MDAGRRHWHPPWVTWTAAGDALYIECHVLEAGWSVPEDPGCELDWVGTELFLDTDVYAGACRGDTFLTDEATPLDYGDGWSAGPLSCLSREDGVTCSHSESGHGFRVSRNSYLVF